MKRIILAASATSGTITADRFGNGTPVVVAILPPSASRSKTCNRYRKRTVFRLGDEQDDAGCSVVAHAASSASTEGSPIDFASAHGCGTSGTSIPVAVLLR